MSVGPGDSISLRNGVGRRFGLTLLAKSTYDSPFVETRSRQGSCALPKFFLIDQSLEGLGGHHFDLAHCLIEAAQRAGWEAIVGAHRRFRPSQTAFKTVSARPLFRNTTYSKNSYLAGMVAMARQSQLDVSDEPIDAVKPTSLLAASKQWLENWVSRHLTIQRRALIRQFAYDCEKFFAPHILEEGDQAFLAGASELELMGLAAFLCNHPRTNQIHWNILFHFNVFSGWPANYAAQFSTAQLVRRCFMSALARVPYHNISFYTTTAELADQYNRLNVAPFTQLSYPVNDRFAQFPATRTAIPFQDKPMRLTLAGAIRREKRQCHVAQSIVNELWGELFAPRKIEMQIQRPRRSRFLRPKIEINLPAPLPAGHSPIHYFEHPLAEEEYVRLIQTTDIGLLAYDSHAYYARRAGILGEYLSAGRPVIVLGGSWLAEQVQESQEQHVESVLAEFEVVETWPLREMNVGSDNFPQNGSVISFDRHRRPFQASFAIAESLDALAVRFRSHFPHQSGAFCRIELRQFKGSQALGQPQTVTVGTRPLAQNVSALFRVDGGAEQCELRLSNACDDSPLSLRDLEAIGVHTGGQVVPRSAVGVIAADVAALPDAIREVVAHYAHYRKSAELFAPAYRARHRPDATFAELVDRPALRSKSA